MVALQAKSANPSVGESREAPLLACAAGLCICGCASFGACFFAEAIDKAEINQQARETAKSRHHVIHPRFRH